MNVIDYNHGLLNRVKGEQLYAHYAGIHGAHLIEQPSGKYVVIYLWSNYCNFWKRTFSTRRDALRAYYDLVKEVEFRAHNAQRSKNA